MFRASLLLGLAIATGCPAKDDDPVETDADTDTDTDADTDTDTDADADADADADTDADTDSDTDLCEDGSEDNDSPTAAVALPAAGVQLNVIQGDDDHYEVEIPPYTLATFDVLFAHADGDIDVVLTVGATTDVSETATDDEQVQFANVTASSVSGDLRVYAYDPGVCIPYSVQVTSDVIEVCDPVVGGKRAFLTSQTYAGDFMGPTSAASGLEGADALCQLHADSAGLGGTWKAWLSDSTTDAIDRIADVGPWYLPDQCTQLFASKASITFSGPEGPFNVDETGTTISPAVAGFWSGTDRFGHSNGFHCSDWTNDSFVGLEGGKGSPYFDWDHQDWWTDFVTNPCDIQDSLFCLEQ